MHFNEQTMKTHFLLLQPSIRPVPAHVITSVCIAHRRNKIVLLLKLLPSRAFPVDR